MKSAILSVASCAATVFVAVTASRASVPSATGPPPPFRPPLVAPEVEPEPRQISDYVREVYQDRRGDHWFGTNGEGVCRFDGRSLDFFGPEQGFAGVAVRGIDEHPDGALWFATDAGVTRYEGGDFTNFTVDDGLSAASCWSLRIDRRGTVWVGTHEGVCRFDGERFVPFALPRVKVGRSEARFSPKVVFAIFEDEVGDLWFGTDGEGVHRWDGASFTSWTTKDGLAGNVVRCIAGDRRGGVWIGTNGGGASRWDGAGFRTFTAKDGLSNDRIYEILEDRAGNVWFSTLGAGACRWDGTSFTAFPPDPDLLIHDRPARSHVQEFFEDRDGVLWIGCSGGLFRFDGTTFVNVTRAGPWPTAVPHGRPDRADDPLAPFAALVGGSWRMGGVGADLQSDTWAWGPGRHALRSLTVGDDGAGRPWTALLVVYRASDDRDARLLGVHPDIPGIGRGTSRGTIAFDGERAESFHDLDQPPGTRRMSMRWRFDGADRFEETLLERGADGAYAPLASWTHERAAADAPPVIFPIDADPPPSPQLRPLAAFLDGRWREDGADGRRTIVRALPLLDAVQVRVESRADDDPLLLEAWLVHDVGRDELRAVVVTRWGDVHEGVVDAPDERLLTGDLVRIGGADDGAAGRGIRVRLELEDRGALRTRVRGEGGAVLLDLVQAPERR